MWNSVLYITSGVFTQTFTANNGCDSIATVNLTINNSSTSLENRTECDSYIWNGITCTTSGNYSYNTINAVGCDSIASLDITVNYSTSTLNSITSCDNYLWNINNQNYTNSGIDTMNSTNNNGPKIEPWGTPDLAHFGEENFPPIKTRWYRSLR